MIEKIKNNKVLRILAMIIKAIVSFFIIIVVSIIFIQRISDNKLTLGGYSIYTIITESMVPKYNVGDMVIAKKIPITELKVNDDIVYLGNKNDFAGKIVTHQIIEIEKKGNELYFHTKGIANMIEDPLVEENQILGKVIMKGTILSLISKIVFKIGSNHLYVMKNIPEFVKARINEEKLIYGKNFIYDPKRHYFSDEDERIIDFIEEKKERKE